MDRPVFLIGKSMLKQAQAIMAAVAMFASRATPMHILRRAMVDGHRHGTRFRRGTKGTPGAFGGTRRKRLSFARLDVARLTAEERKAARRGGAANAVQWWGMFVGERG